VSEVVLTALEKRPALRFASVQAFADALVAAFGTAPLQEQDVSHVPSLLPLIPTVDLSPPTPKAPVAGTILSTYREHTHHVHTLAWSPDGRRMVSGSRDRTVQVWDAATGNRLGSHAGHSDQVKAVAWSSDGGRIASAGNDGTVQVWQAP